MAEDSVVINEPITIEIYGKCPGKKNDFRTRKGGGLMVSKTSRAMIDRISMQIPGRHRNLRLESPEMEFQFYYTKANWDRDNAFTTLLDVLVTMGVIRNDNIARCNGKITIHPAERAEYDRTVIVIKPK